MKAKKLLNADGSTNKIVVRKDNGAYNSFTPKEAAEMIELLRRQLWRGIPISKRDVR